MINFSLVLDGNYMLQKNVHILFKNKILYSELYNAMERDFNTLTRLYPFSKIYFISDGVRNWRKDFYTEYKGKRKKDEKIDWDFVFKEYDRLKTTLVPERKNCVQIQINNLEGDDIIGFLIKALNEKGISTFLMSHDSDLFQLIKYDLDKRFINIMYNFKMNDERLYLPIHYEMFLRTIEGNFEESLFEDNDESEFIEFLNKFINTKRTSTIDSEFELFQKIMGHNKDNIKSVYIKGDRGIGKNGILKIYDMYKETYKEPIDFNSEDFRKRLISVIKLYKRLKDNSQDEIIKERIIRNLKLVKLDEHSTPKNLYEQMKKEIVV